MTAANWQRVSRRTPCPICGKPDWCLIAVDGNAAICARTESSKPVRSGAGWLHRLRDDVDHPATYRRVIVQAIPEAQQRSDFTTLAERYQRAVKPEALVRLAVQLGVTLESLRRLRIGWDGSAWTFPMTDATGGIVGIRRRLPDGMKLSVRGSHEGLFVPTDLPETGQILICEGPTDTAAMLDLGFAAVGRPSCTGAVRICCQLAKGRDAVIVADSDEPGRRGAAALASALVLYCPTIRTIYPPADIKDARQWRQAGATAADIDKAISMAEVKRLTISGSRMVQRGR